MQADLRRVNMTLVRMAQRQAFSQEIEGLSKEQKGRISRNILSSNFFLDKKEILRVGGRMKNADLVYDQRFLIIFPSNYPFSTLLIREMHYKYLHKDSIL